MAKGSTRRAPVQASETLANLDGCDTHLKQIIRTSGVYKRPTRKPRPWSCSLLVVDTLWRRTEAQLACNAGVCDQAGSIDTTPNGPWRASSAYASRIEDARAARQGTWLGARPLTLWSWYDWNRSRLPIPRQDVSRWDDVGEEFKLMVECLVTSQLRDLFLDARSILVPNACKINKRHGR